MSKAEFLQELEKRLHVLNEKERQDVLGEYAQHIDLKIANGMSEEEAVKDFGSIEELIGELLDAYSINTEYAAGETKESAEKEKNIAQTVCRAAGETAEKAGSKAVFSVLVESCVYDVGRLLPADTPSVRTSVTGGSAVAAVSGKRRKTQKTA